jgi:hypothetical protein
MDTAAGLQVDGDSDVNDKCYAVQTGGYVLDVEELQRRLTQAANATFTEGPSLERGSVVGLERKPNALRTLLKKGVEVALWPISKPVQGILYVQRHWEEFFWNSIDSAMRKSKGTNMPDPAHTARKLTPSTFTSELPLLSNSPMPRSSTPPQLGPFSPQRGLTNKRDLAALTALEEAQLKYSHLHLAHALNTQSFGSRDEERESPLRSDGTISRLEISRSSLERRLTKDHSLWR